MLGLFLISFIIRFLVVLRDLSPTLSATLSPTMAFILLNGIVTTIEFSLKSKASLPYTSVHSPNTRRGRGSWRRGRASRLRG